MLAIQAIGLFFGIWLSAVVIGNVITARCAHTVSLVLMSAGWTAFIMPFLI